MNTKPGLEQCLSFINCQLKPRSLRAGGAEAGLGRRAVTISRQTGCGALAVAEKVAACLQASAVKDSVPWTVFDRNLVEKVLEDHHLPQRLTRFMPENWTSQIEDTMDELFGLHPPSWILVRQTADTILRLATLGNVILIGRGGNVITAKLDHVLHVRLVASLDARVERIMACDHLDRKAALEFIQREDRGRKRYMRKYYHQDISDPQQYHLTINTGLVGYDAAAQIIGNAVESCTHPRGNRVNGVTIGSGGLLQARP